MALTVAQIITLACQDASCPGYTVQAGQKLNLILQELAQDYTLSTNQGWISGNFGAGIGGVVNSAAVVAGSGPFQLPADFLRMDFHDFFWQNGGINYFPTPLDIDQFDELVQQPGFSSYPTAFAVDMSTSPAGLYVWPAPSAAYPYFGRYHRQNPDMPSPETSGAVPWFPSQAYLMRRLTGEMMITTGDVRAEAMLGDAPQHPEGARAVLNRYLKQEDNRSNRSVTVKLDPRHFGPSWQRLPGTKAVPW